MLFLGLNISKNAKAVALKVPTSITIPPKSEKIYTKNKMLVTTSVTLLRVSPVTIAVGIVC